MVCANKTEWKERMREREMRALLAAISVDDWDCNRGKLVYLVFCLAEALTHRMSRVPNLARG
jgi:hypothetical protein